MRIPGLNGYDVILAGTWYLRELLESIVLEESLDEIAMRATITLAAGDDLPSVEPGHSVQVSGIPFGCDAVAELFNGVVWEPETIRKGRRRATLTCYDRSLFIAKSEDEYLLNAGQSASQRLRNYARDWEIPVGNMADTGIQLASAIYRSQPIYKMILQDLKETIAKGGQMYRPRMNGTCLEMVPIGANTVVWVLKSGQNIEELAERASLEGMATQVKVLGEAEEEGLSPVLAIEKGDTARYGTLQKVIQNSTIETTAQARQAAVEFLAGPMKTIGVSAIDINTIRAGDKVLLNDQEIIVASVKHVLGDPGQMTLDLATEQAVRRRFYARSL